MKKAILIVCLFILTLAFTSPAIACDCLEPWHNAFQELENSEAVFIGQVVDAKEVKVSTGKNAGSFDYQMEVKFMIEKRLKGVEGIKVVLYTGSRCCECGFSFKRNEKYLVFAYMYEGRLSTDYCTRTKRLARAGKDLKEIAQGQKRKEKRRQSSVPQAKHNKSFEPTANSAALICQLGG
jgi:hypothetical protein